MKKFILVFLIFALLTFLILTGCKTGVTPEETSTETPLATSTTVPILTSTNPQAQGKLELEFKPSVVDIDYTISSCQIGHGGWQYTLTIKNTGSSTIHFTKLEIYIAELGEGVEGGAFSLLRTIDADNIIFQTYFGSSLSGGESKTVSMLECRDDPYHSGTVSRYVMYGKTEDGRQVSGEDEVVLGPLEY